MQIMVTSGGIQALILTLTALAGFGLFLVKMVIASEIRKLNGRWLFSDGVHLTGRDIEKRFENLEERMDHGPSCVHCHVKPLSSAQSA